MPVDFQLVGSRSPAQLPVKRFGLDAKNLAPLDVLQDSYDALVHLTNAVAHWAAKTSRAEVKPVNLEFTASCIA